MSSPSSPPRRPESLSAPFAALVAGALAMGVSPILVRLADVGPFASAFWRVALALPLLYAWMRLASAAGRARRAAILQRGDPGRPRLRRRSLLLASVDRQHQRRQCDFLRHHRADLGGAVRLADFPHAAVRAASWPGSACASPAEARCSRRACTSRPAGAVGDVFGLATGVFFGLYFLAVQAARDGLRRRASPSRRRTITAALLLSSRSRRALGSCRTRRRAIAALIATGLDQPCRRPGPAGGGARPAPGGLFVAGHLSRGDRGGGFAWLILGEPVALVQALGGLAILVGIFVARPR